MTPSDRRNYSRNRSRTPKCSYYSSKAKRQIGKKLNHLNQRAMSLVSKGFPLTLEAVKVVKIKKIKKLKSRRRRKFQL